jgi:hypothetical protein
VRLEAELVWAMKPSASPKLTRIATSAIRIMSRTAELWGIATKVAPTV